MAQLNSIQKQLINLEERITFLIENGRESEVPQLFNTIKVLRQNLRDQQ